WHRVPANQARDVFHHATEAFLLEIASALLQRVGDSTRGAAEESFLRSLLLDGFAQVLDAASRGTGRLVHRTAHRGTNRPRRAADHVAHGRGRFLRLGT